MRSKVEGQLAAVTDVGDRQRCGRVCTRQAFELRVKQLNQFCGQQQIKALVLISGEKQSETRSIHFSRHFGLYLMLFLSRFTQRIR